MQFKNMRVEVGKACSKSSDVAGPEPEALVLPGTLMKSYNKVLKCPTYN